MMAGMVFPHSLILPDTLGTGLVVQSTAPVDDTSIRAFVDEYERTLSRFRSDSILAAMAGAAHGGSFDFPDWCEPLFDLYERLCEATDDAIDPCVGAALARLGYGPDLAFETGTSDSQRIWVAHPTWRHDVERHGTTLVTARPVHLDFGACGKGYLVDLIAAMLTQQTTVRPGYAPDFVIDAGGDILAHTSPPITVALEDPHDTSRAVGIAHIDHAAIAASAPSRRHWRTAGDEQVHHLLNAVDGLPVTDMAATWAVVDMRPGGTARSANRPAGGYFPTALADGLATALFLTDPERLAQHFDFACVTIRTDRVATRSRHFPGTLFTG